MARYRKHLQYAKKLSPDVPGRMSYVVEGFNVVEVQSDPLPTETVVYFGHDAGSAHVVAQALALYGASGGLSVGPQRSEYRAARLAAGSLVG